MELKFVYEHGHVVVYQNGIFLLSADTMSEAIREAENAQGT